MIAEFEKINLPESQSFYFKNYKIAAFDAPFHYHPEFELTLIEKGIGKRYVGSNVSDFCDGDLVLLGPNVPHCWICNCEAKKQEDYAAACVIQFSKNFIMQEGFSSLPEFNCLSALFIKAQNGVVIEFEARKIITQLIRLMKNANELKRLSCLLEIFVVLTESNQALALPNQMVNFPITKVNREKLQKIYNYIILNYRNRIYLTEVAALVNLTPNSFCRFFRQVTGKSLVEEVNEYRLNHAVNLLKNTGMNVSEIAYDCGFNNVPYFNTVFRKKYFCSPNEFRKCVE